MEYFLILLIILLYTFQSFFCKTFSENYPGRSDLSSKVFTIFSGIVVAFISTAITGFNFSASPATIIIGILCALALVIYNASLIKASAYGPYSVLMVFAIAGGIIVPAFFAAVFGDKISVVKIICIAIIISAIYLVSRKGNETYTDKKNFFITCTQLALANGAYATFLDLQQRLTGTEEKEEMVALTYFFAALISATGLALKEKKAFPRAMKQTKKSAIYLIITSLIVASAINLLAYLISTGFDLTLLFTLENACVYLLSVVLSCIFFKEKLSKLNIFGCIILCIALVCMSVFG